MKMVGVLLKIVPIGVFALIAKVFADQGIQALIPLASYFSVVLLVLVLHATVTYSLLLWLVGNLNPIHLGGKQAQFAGCGFL